MEWNVCASFMQSIGLCYGVEFMLGSGTKVMLKLWSRTYVTELILCYGVELMCECRAKGEFICR